MRYLLIAILLSGCSSITRFPGPVQDYTISETRKMCLDDGECLTVTYVQGSADCSKWDADQPFGWSQCNPKTIPAAAKKYALNP